MFCKPVQLCDIDLDELLKSLSDFMTYELGLVQNYYNVHSFFAAIGLFFEVREFL